MSQTAITLAFEQHLAELQLGGQPVVPDEFVLAYIPGLDLLAPIDRAAGLPPAGQIVHRQPVDQRGKVNANGVAYSIIMDTQVGDFTFNAMYLVHKASGMVAMVVHKADEDKFKNLTNRPGNSLVKSMLMEYQGAAEATNTQVDASTWQIDFTARLLGLDEDIRLQALDHYGNAAFIDGGFAVIPGQGVNEFLVAPGLGYIAGLRAQLASQQSVVVAQRPATLYADVYHAGTLLSDWHTHIEIKASSTPLTDYVDGTGYPHYVVPIASLAANGAVTDLRGRGGLWWHEHRPQAHTKEQVGLDKLENWSWSHSYTGGSPTKYATEKGVTDAHGAAKNYTDTAIANLVDTAPGTLDTLNELAAALGDDPNFATTMTTELSKKLNSTSYTAADVLAKLKTVHGANSGLDTDTIHGVYLRQIWPTASNSNFPNGTLVTTDIPADIASGASFLIEITGKGYQGRTHNAIAEGYIYNNGIIQAKGINLTASTLTQIKVFEHGGVLCFWWPNTGYWDSFFVTVKNTKGFISRNHVVSIDDELEPIGSKKETITLDQPWYNHNAPITALRWPTFDEITGKPGNIGGEVGEVSAFALVSPPAGWLKANGAAVSRATYAALFAAIGTTFGAGDGATTFNLPDIRGEFPRGWDDGRGVDVGRLLGSNQSDAFQGHTFSVNGYNLGEDGLNVTGGGIRSASFYNSDTYASIASDGVNGVPRTAAETRPRNVALLYCIKY